MNMLVLDESSWEPQGEVSDPRSRLYCSGIFINGTPMHCTAIAVHDDDTGCQVVTDPEVMAGDEDYEALVALSGDGGAFVTVPIGQRQYVVFLMPHCA